MKRYAVVRLIVSLVLLLSALSLGYGTAARAYAQSKGTPLPQFKQPNSARFDITGSVTSGGLGGQDTAITITGAGAISGQDFEQSISYDMPADPATSTSAQSFSMEAKMVGGKYYVKFGTLLGGSPDQWYIIDTGEAETGSGALPNLDSFGTDYTVTEDGKETLNGVSTTRYKVDIDTASLFGDLDDLDQGSSSSTSTFTIVVYLWVGDTDQYLHKYKMLFDMKSSFKLDEENTYDLHLAMDLALTMKDIDQPVTITAPEDAIPFDSLAGGSAGSTGATDPVNLANLTGLLGVSTGMPAGMPGIAPTTGVEAGSVGAPDMGMPKTGGPIDSLPWTLLALALGSIALGSAIKLLYKPLPVKA